ncbi:zinc metalloprotease [Mesorhizobium waimense]|nr:zinc metalloprotease [Mesorhizobium waimense]
MAELEAQFIQDTRITEADLSLIIPVHFIHVVDGEQGAISAVQRKQQVKVLNDAYAPMGIVFTAEEGNVSVVDNPEFFRMGHMSARERNCKTQNQAVDPKRGLNFYTAEPGGGLLGWATFPFQMEGDPAMDGVVIMHSSLPGGTGAPYDLGMTAVHEVGHWLGLYHTFQDACVLPGDEVSDTPAHSGPNYGKPADAEQPHNLCANASAGAECPIHNYMNYVDDDWMHEFTNGQRERMWAQVGMFRRDLLTSQAAAAVAEEAEVWAQVRW